MSKKENYRSQANRFSSIAEPKNSFKYEGKTKFCSSGFKNFSKNPSKQLRTSSRFALGHYKMLTKTIETVPITINKG